jgi:hypothetical protein
MSNDTPAPESNDPLLAALRQLPVAPLDGPQDVRRQREARAAYLRSFEGSSWHGSTGRVSRLVMPVFLAGIVGLYMTWAIAAATAIVH